MTELEHLIGQKVKGISPYPMEFGLLPTLAIDMEDGSCLVVQYCRLEKDSYDPMNCYSCGGDLPTGSIYCYHCNRSDIDD